MAAKTLKLFVDIEGGGLVQSDGNAAPVALPPLYQGDTVFLEVYALDRTSNYPLNYNTSPFSKASVAGRTLRVGIGAAPTGATGTAAPTIYQSTFVQDTENNKWTGSLYIDPTAAAAIIGSANASGTGYIEIEIVNEDATYTTLYQSAVTLKAELIEASGAPAVSAPAGDRFLTYAEALALFTRIIGPVGGTLQLTSPDGTKGILLGCNDDGTLKSDSIAL